MVKHYFSLPEAKEALQSIVPLLKEALLIKQSLDELNTIEIMADDTALEEINFVSLNKHFHYLSYKLFLKLEEIERSGAIVKDMDQGLVDFPSLFEGREIFLCYQFGENSIHFFHEGEDGFEGRKSITEIEHALAKQ